MNFKIIVPFIILFALLGLFYRTLFYTKPGEIPSVLIGQNIPYFSLPDLLTDKTLTSTEFKSHVVLLNVWATWCYACALEHQMLLKIKEEYHVPIYSIDYKDDPSTARQWLEENGNPFSMTGIDANGNVAIDLGVYGTPETFIVNTKGKIVYRHIGAIDQKTWDDVLYPLVKKYENEM